MIKKPVKYNLLFIPHFRDRLKLSSIRKNISREVFSTQALQYPIHMSVISGGFYPTDYKNFERELVELLKNETAFKVSTEGKQSIVLAEKFWTGIHINRNNEITSLQQKLQNLRNKYTEDTKELKESRLHITFAFPAKVDELDPVKLPVTEFLIDRITIVKKIGGETAPYIIHKHIRLHI